ncbi:MAG: class I SAM-dependent methyltransferase [Planctomycetota bacterium]|jgi:hypothetical protein
MNTINNTHHKRQSCRSCGKENLRLFLSLGPTPLANSFLKSPDEFNSEPCYPLDVYFCETCSLVQLLDVIDPETLFSNYIYTTGTSDTIGIHNLQYAKTVVELLKLGSNDLVVEVASNDGSLLKCFKEHGVKTLGIEPATNIAKKATAGGINTINKFFNSMTSKEVKKSHGLAKTIIGNNVFAHVDDTQDFLTGCKELLEQDGLIIIEAPYLGNFINQMEYDTVYHEHLCYFSVNALIRLCNTVKLSIIRFDLVPVHGGSFRMYVGLKGQHKEHSKDVLKFAEEEKQMGLTGLSRFERFAEGVKENQRAVRALLKSLRDDGKTIAGYGAPAKGNTLLNYCCIDTNIIPYTVDKNPLKIGLYTPGMHIPVLPVSTLIERQPDYVLILAWNFAEEIMKQQQEYYNRGGKFIIPIPEPRVV